MDILNLLEWDRCKKGSSYAFNCHSSNKIEVIIYNIVWARVKCPQDFNYYFYAIAVFVFHWKMYMMLEKCLWKAGKRMFIFYYEAMIITYTFNFFFISPYINPVKLTTFSKMLKIKKKRDAWYKIKRTVGDYHNM